ncbi:MAG: zinc ribbon domain-containing protein [Chloroflexia bacterium]|nr:zinc ribbon domain-containing protein [Chloroflexia bacterium]
MDVEAIVARGLQVLLALGGAYLLALWFVLIVWTFRDIESRSRSVLTQVMSTLLVVLFWVPGMMLYWVLRPKQTLDDTYQRSLEEEYLLQDLEELPVCPTCQHFVQDDFRLCPHCQTELRDPCIQCNRLIDLRWDLCPYCGSDQDKGEVPAAIEPPVERWVAVAASAREPAIDAESDKALPAGVASEQRVVSATPSIERLERLRFGRAIRPGGERNGAAREHGNGRGSVDQSPASSGDNRAESSDDETSIDQPTVPRRFKVDS